MELLARDDILTEVAASIFEVDRQGEVVYHNGRVPPGLDDLDHYIRRHLAELPVDATFTHTPADGLERTVRLRMWPTGDTVTCLFEDETMRRHVRAAVHDFNNMLTVISGQSDLLSRRLDQDDPRHALVMELREAGNRASEIARHLLAFMRQNA